jgi:hypothetical protein
MYIFRTVFLSIVHATRLNQRIVIITISDAYKDFIKRDVFGETTWEKTAKKKREALGLSILVKNPVLIFCHTENIFASLNINSSESEEDFLLWRRCHAIHKRYSDPIIFMMVNITIDLSMIYVSHKSAKILCHSIPIQSPIATKIPAFLPDWSVRVVIMTKSGPGLITANKWAPAMSKNSDIKTCKKYLSSYYAIN